MVPVLRGSDGRERALGPRELALCLAVLDVADRMRGTQGYQIHLHVKEWTVVVQTLRHEANWSVSGTGA